MIPEAVVRSYVPHAIVIIRFQADPDLGLACVADHDHAGQFSGISLVMVRKSSGSRNPSPVKPELLRDVFKAQITKRAKNKYIVHVRPFQDHDIVLTRFHDQYVALFPFRDHQPPCAGKMRTIDVHGSMFPKPVMNFRVHATYRASKATPIENLTTSVRGGDDFVRDLRAFFGM